MKGLCKTDCGLEVEYESHKFSDGFAYYLPRNLNGKPHNCIFGEDEGFFNYQDDSVEEFYQKHKERLNISVDSFIEIRGTYGAFEYIDIPMDDQFMDMVREGKLFELKKYVENQLNMITVPYLAHRSDFRWPQDNVLDIELKNATQQQIIGYTWIELPTNQGYQLEYLGIIYELMIRLEDAKKCFELQYECTKEPELLKKSRELDKKIQEMNETRRITENIPDDLTPEYMDKIIKSTELNIKKYVVELFSNNFKELFKKNPDIKEQTQKIRKKDEDTMLNFDDSSEIGTASLGTLRHILKKSRGTEMAKCDETCKICGIDWEENEWIFSESTPEKISCIDKTCFVKQGGMAKNVKLDMIHRISNINKIRNILSHPRKSDQEMLKKYLMEAYVTCDILNTYIEKELKNKQFA
jgi:hypothetical protein